MPGPVTAVGEGRDGWVLGRLMWAAVVVGGNRGEELSVLVETQPLLFRVCPSHIGRLYSLL